VSGALNMFGGRVRFDIMMAKLAAKFGFAIDLSIDGILINKAFNTVLGEKLAAVIVPFDVKKLDFTLSTEKIDLNSYDTLGWGGVQQIPRGVAFTVKAAFAKRSNNALFKMLSDFMPGDFQLQISFDGNKLALKLILPDIKFSSNAILTDAAISIGAELQPSFKLFVGVGCTLKAIISGDTLLFKASIEASLGIAAKVTISLALEGTWTKAFGIKKLSIGDLIGEVGLTMIPPYIVALKLGGTMTIGEPHEDPITGKLYFSIDLADPTNNYFYGSVNRLVIGQFLKIVFGVNGIPPLIAESGFPRGLMMSFGFKETRTPAGDMVYPGFYMKGSLQILGFGGDAEVQLSPERNKISVALTPFKVGCIQFSRNKGDTANGPYFLVDMVTAPFSFRGEMEAYLKLAIFEFYAKIAVGTNSFMVQIETPIFIIFEAKLKVEATYPSGNFASSSFKFDAEIKTGKIKDAVVSAIRNFREAATAGFKKATAAIDSATNAINDAYNRCMNACGLKCPGFIEYLAHAQSDAHGEAGVAFLETLVETKDHQEFDISIAEWHFIEQLAQVDSMSHLSAEHWIQQGVMVDTETVLEQMAHSELNTKLRFDAMHSIESLDQVDVYIREGISMLQMYEKSILEHDIAIHGKLKWGWFKKAVKTVARGVTSVAKKVVSVAKTVGKGVVSVAKTVGKAVVNVGCQAAALVCKGACQTTKVASAATGMASSVVSGLSSALSACLGFIETILNGFDIFINIGGGLNAEAFSFYTNFRLRVGSANIGFGVNIDFRMSKLSELANMIWEKVKEYILKSVPGIGKLF